jgi:hypothetical protein
MTSLRPLVIPAAAIMLAAITPGADARTRKAVTRVWVATPGPALQTAAVGMAPARALPVRPATTLPVAARTTPGESAVPGGHHPAAAELTGTAAAGRTATATARGPPG